VELGPLVTSLVKPLGTATGGGALTQAGGVRGGGAGVGRVEGKGGTGAPVWGSGGGSHCTGDLARGGRGV